MTDKRAIVPRALEFADKLKERLSTKQLDDEFNELRGEAGRLLQQLAIDGDNSKVISEIQRAIARFETLSKAKISDVNRQRSVVNQAVLSSRIRSTHYAAYIAGRFGNSDGVGNKFKCWLHNIAAHSATEAAFVIEILSNIAEPKSGDKDIINVAKVFQNSALVDARRFLAWAQTYDRGSVLTAYNTARLDICSRVPDQISFGIEALLSIREPSSHAEGPDISWHQNNLESFNTDANLNQLIRKHAAHRHVLIKAKLEENSRIAGEILESRGSDLWKGEHLPNRIAYGAFAATFLTVGIFAYDNTDLIAKGWELSTDIYDYLYAILSHSDAHQETAALIAAAGDGGLADKTLFARATFGDGGLGLA
jgi:ribosomal protein L29